MPLTARPLFDIAPALLGEGALWDAADRTLLWVDILRGEVHRYDPATGRDRAVSLHQFVGTVVPRRSGGLVVALHHGFAFLDFESEHLDPIADPEADLPANRFNDGKCDPAGRFWAGTMDVFAKLGAAALYRLDPDRTVHRMLDNVTISNGIVWSLDNTQMYYIDTPTGKVEAFDYDLATGAIANRRTAVQIPAGMGHPDGMTLDAEGMVWVALWGGWAVARFNPRTGELLEKIDVPASNVTSCAFGGPHLTDLYITTAQEGLDPAALQKQPDAGRLFRATPAVPGLPAFSFAG